MSLYKRGPPDGDDPVTPTAKRVRRPLSTPGIYKPSYSDSPFAPGSISAFDAFSASEFDSWISNIKRRAKDALWENAELDRRRERDMERLREAEERLAKERERVTRFVEMEVRIRKEQEDEFLRRAQEIERRQGRKKKSREVEYGRRESVPIGGPEYTASEDSEESEEEDVEDHREEEDDDDVESDEDEAEEEEQGQYRIIERQYNPAQEESDEEEEQQEEDDVEVDENEAEDEEESGYGLSGRQYESEQEDSGDDAEEQPEEDDIEVDQNVAEEEGHTIYGLSGRQHKPAQEQSDVDEEADVQYLLSDDTDELEDDEEQEDDERAPNEQAQFESDEEVEDEDEDEYYEEEPTFANQQLEPLSFESLAGRDILVEDDYTDEEETHQDQDYSGEVYDLPESDQEASLIDEEHDEELSSAEQELAAQITAIIEEQREQDGELDDESELEEEQPEEIELVEDESDTMTRGWVSANGASTIGNSKEAVDDELLEDEMSLPIQEIPLFDDLGNSIPQTADSATHAQSDSYDEAQLQPFMDNELQIQASSPVQALPTFTTAAKLANEAVFVDEDAIHTQNLPESFRTFQPLNQFPALEDQGMTQMAAVEASDDILEIDPFLMPSEPPIDGASELPDQSLSMDENMEKEETIAEEENHNDTAFTIFGEEEVEQEEVGGHSSVKGHPRIAELSSVTEEQNPALDETPEEET